MRMSLKRLGLISVAALAMTSAAQAQQTVVWWDFLAGGDGVRMKALIDAFNEEHQGDIQIDGTTLEWGTPFYTKLQTSSAIGEGPDIATYHLSRIPLAVDSGTLSEITDEDMEAAGLSDSDFTNAAVEAAKVDGTRYAVPFDQHGLILYYNKEMLDEAGMLDENGLPTGLDGMDNFEAALDEFTTEDGQYGLSMPTGDRYRAVYSFFGQQGGTMFDAEAGGFFPTDEDVEKLATATETMKRWVDNGWTPSQIESPASLALFTSGQAAFFIMGNWEVPTFTDLAAKGEMFDWGAVELPVLFDQKAAWSDSHAFVIPANAGQGMDAEKREAVMEVIGWMDRHSLDWAGAGHIPALKAVREGDEFNALKPQSDYAGFADTAVFDPRTVLAGPAAPLGDAWGNFINPATTGELDPADAAAEMRDDLNSQL
ncbi:sugar ABC transporter substrate-binding protein [Devosia pacifica]|uniref:Sugar ABC transporter substrate-binding protein n=1 Tax=Devosia pacifica TaxID=1335967 RepID=A0A918SBL7_9HYPH|nr:extracellular solute-binding protein [Devosia pacifica]GHA33137.1 sugar ABC transporter substrate-binding protein [Devosia pacifica]